MKLKPIVAALVAAAALPAFAVINGGATGNGNLFLTIQDSVAQVSFTQNLGLDQNGFWVSGQATTGSSFAHDVLSADPNWAAFLATPGVNAANWQWAVLASETTGGNGAASGDGTTTAGQRLFTTVNASQTSLIGTMTNLAFNNALGSTQMGSFLTAVNATGTQTAGNSVAGVGSSVNAAPSVAYFGQAGGTGPNLNNNAPFIVTSSVGTAAPFYFIGRSGTSQTAMVNATQFTNGTNLGSFVLNNVPATGYTLDYTLAPVNTVPEPNTALLLLAGVGVFASLGRRRFGR